jgi:hypothetical protein
LLDHLVVLAEALVVLVALLMEVQVTRRAQAQAKEITVEQ